MTWPTCEEGFNLRKLTTFASQVVSDFRSLPLQPRKVVVLEEDSPEILLDGLDLASWGGCWIRHMGTESGVYSEGEVIINGDTDRSHYRSQLVMIHGTGRIQVVDGEVSGEGNMFLEARYQEGGIGPPVGPDRAQVLIWVAFLAGKVRGIGFTGNSPFGADYWVCSIVNYAPTVENVTTITFRSLNPDVPYRAGTRVEVW